jgi:hypothetical protein
MHVYVKQIPLNTYGFLQAYSQDAYRWTVRRGRVSLTSFGFNHVTFSHNCRMPPSWPRTWYGHFCSIYHLLSTDGGIPIARHIVWTISTGRAVDCGVIIVWNTHKIGRRVCAGHGYHPLLPSLMNKVSQTTINFWRRSTIIQQMNIGHNCIAVPRPTYDVHGSTNWFDVYIISWTTYHKYM